MSDFRPFKALSSMNKAVLLKEAQALLDIVQDQDDMLYAICEHLGIEIGGICPEQIKIELERVLRKDGVEIV